MAIQINGNGTITGISAGGLPAGSVTSATLADGSVATAKIADSAVTPAKSTIQGGKIIQFKQAAASGQHSSANAGGDGQDVAGMSQSITLTSSSNKVLVMISCNPYIGGSGGTGGRYALKLFRDTTMIYEDTYLNFRENDGTCKATRSSHVYLDNPADTSSHTYKVALKKESGSNTVYLMDEGANAHTITLMEVDVS